MIHSPPPCLLSYQRGLSLKADLCGGDIIPSGETAETVIYPRYPLFLTVPCTAQEPWVKFGGTGLESVSQSYLCIQQDFLPSVSCSHPGVGVGVWVVEPCTERKSRLLKECKKVDGVGKCHPPYQHHPLGQPCLVLEGGQPRLCREMSSPLTKPLRNPPRHTYESHMATQPSVE